MVYLYLFRNQKDTSRSAWREKLKTILKNDFGRNNCEIVFCEGKKPVLKDRELFFNVSHSRDALAIAVSTCDVGVDIEYLDRTVSDRVRRYCLNEKEALLIDADDSSAFIRLWTAKESYLKLIGEGLKISMSDFCAAEDKFFSDSLPPALFTRFERDGLTVSVAAKGEEQLKIIGN